MHTSSSEIKVNPVSQSIVDEVNEGVMDVKATNGEKEQKVNVTENVPEWKADSAEQQVFGAKIERILNDYLDCVAAIRFTPKANIALDFQNFEHLGRLSQDYEKVMGVIDKRLIAQFEDSLRQESNGLIGLEFLKNIHSKTILLADQYAIRFWRHHYFDFIYCGKRAPAAEKKAEQIHGHKKIQINIQCKTKETYYQACKHILTVLMAHGIVQFKFLTWETYHHKWKYEQAGKAVTVYASLTPNKNWQVILRQIDKVLSQSGISPGLRAIFNLPLNRYTSLKSENLPGKQGEYFNIKQCWSYYCDFVKLKPKQYYATFHKIELLESKLSNLKLNSESKQEELSQLELEIKSLDAITKNQYYKQAGYFDAKFKAKLGVDPQCWEFPDKESIAQLLIYAYDLQIMYHYLPRIQHELTELDTVLLHEVNWDLMNEFRKEMRNHFSTIKTFNPEDLNNVRKIAQVICEHKLLARATERVDARSLYLTAETSVELTSKASTCSTSSSTSSLFYHGAISSNNTSSTSLTSSYSSSHDSVDGNPTTSIQTTTLATSSPT